MILHDVDAIPSLLACAAVAGVSYLLLAAHYGRGDLV
jgi:hypothetical protein